MKDHRFEAPEDGPAIDVKKMEEHRAMWADIQNHHKAGQSLYSRPSKEEVRQGTFALWVKVTIWNFLFLSGSIIYFFIKGVFSILLILIMSASIIFLILGIVGIYRNSYKDDVHTKLNL